MKQNTRLLRLLMPLLFPVLALSTAQADEPVVRAVLFWSKTCPHCQVVLNETLPPLREKHGDQLQVLTVEVSDQAGYELWMLAIETLRIPTDRLQVPMLLIGDRVLVGSYDIPNELPGLIERHLAAGGVDYPPIPGLRSTASEAVEVWVGALPTVATQTALPTVATSAPATAPSDAVVHFWLFYDSHCDHCITLEKEILPPILTKYREGQVVVHEWDLEKSDAPLMYALEAKYGLEYGDVPEIFIGDHALLGNDEIQAQLEALIDHYLAQGGVDLPQAELPTPAPVATSEVTAPPIHLAYFYQPGCRECDRVSLDLNYLRGRYPQLAVQEFDVKAEAALCEWLGKQAGVPEEKRLTAPAVFVGEEALVGEALTAKALEALVARYAATGAEAAWAGWEGTQDQAAGSIVERFRSFGVFTVLAAGLVDGLNPCAFAAIVFFISYLAFVGRGRRGLSAHPWAESLEGCHTHPDRPP